MARSTDRSAARQAPRSANAAFRVAFLGQPVWLDVCAPTAEGDLLPAHFPLAGDTDVATALAGLADFRPQATVVFDPAGLPALALDESAGVSLGVLTGDLPAGDAGDALDAFDRLLSFRPRLTGMTLGRHRLWRAIPPPINDRLFGEVRPLHGPPRVMSVGSSTAHRERVLIQAKHHYDLLELLHGGSGELLAQLLAEYDVGVYVARDRAGGFGAQVGMHLAAGQLLLTDGLEPTHGLERNIDYLQVDTAGQLAWTLERLARFPEMYQRVRIRGRMKAEQYRSSRLFARVVHDLLADVAAFGRS